MKGCARKICSGRLWGRLELGKVYFAVVEFLPLGGNWGRLSGYLPIILLTALRRGQRPGVGCEKIFTVPLPSSFKKFRLFKSH